MSSRAGAEELEQILAIVRPAVLVIDGEFAELAAAAIAEASPQTKLLRRDRELAAWKSAPAAPLAPVPRKPDDPAFWVMTSGTTGVPKAVEHHHRNVGICARILRAGAGLHAATTACSRPRASTSPMRSATCSRRCGWARATSCWSAGPPRRASPRRWSASSRPCCSACPRSITGCSKPAWPQTAPFRALRHFVSAGERMPPQIWNAWEEAGGHPILDGLGCSECVYMIIGNTPARRKPGSSGQAMPSVELRIVDDAGAVDRRARHARAARGADAVGLRGLSLTPASALERAAAAAGRAVPAGRLVLDRRRICPRRRRLLSSPRPHRRHAAGVRHLDFAGRDRGCARGPCLGRRERGGAGRKRDRPGRDRALCRAGGGRGRRRRWPRRASGWRRRCRATSSRGASRRSPICRAPRPAKSSATSCASCCAAISVEVGDAYERRQRRCSDPAAACPLCRGLRSAGRRGLPQPVQPLVQALPEELAAARRRSATCRSIPTISRIGPSMPPARTGRSRPATISCARSR